MVELLEREPLLETLAGHLGAAAAGSGRLVLLAGEAGIGKTTLTRAFCDQHPEAAIWWGACDALTTPRPLGPLHDIARAAGGDLVAVMASDATRHERFTALLEVITSPLRPLVLVFEDVHWADEATRDLLVYLARRITSTHALAIATYRDDEVDPRHPLRTVLGHLVALPAVHRLTLAPLSQHAVSKLTSGHHRDPALLHRITGGNPFYVTEVLATGTDALPATVADAVLARTAGLSTAARAALEAAAITPDHAEVDFVQAVGDVDPGSIDECIQRGLLQLDRRSVRFRHELARLAVAHQIPTLRGVALHTRALAHLASKSYAEPARLAHHAQAAGDHEAVLRYAPQAAQHAARLGAHREAVAHYRRALDHSAALPPRDRAALLEAYAEECTAVDRAADAIRAAGEAIDIWHEQGEVERAGILRSKRAYLLWGSGRSKAARDEVAAAVAMLRQREPGVALATAYTYTAHLHMLAREIPPAIELGNRAAAIAEQHADPVLRARALNIVGAAQWFVEPDRAEATLTEALRLAHRSTDDTVVGVVLRMLGSGAGEVRRYAIADRWLAEGVRWCAEHDLDIHGHYCLAWSARSAYEQGRWSEAAAAVDAALKGTTEHAPTRIVALTVLGRLRTRRGDPDPDGPLAEAWQLAQETGDLQRLWPVAAGRAEAAWLAGHPERIPDLAADTYQLAVRLQQEWPVGELAYWLWKAGALDPIPSGAAEPFAQQLQDDWRRAAETWESIGCPYEAAWARAEGDDPEQLRAALATFTRLGANPGADFTTAALRRLGVRDLPRRPNRSTAANPAGLTDRELEVLTLLTQGATNQELARKLHISARTAGHHVSAILAKLDVPTRQRAAQTALEMGIVSRK